MWLVPKRSISRESGRRAVVGKKKRRNNQTETETEFTKVEKQNRTQTETERERERTGLNQIKSNKTSPKSVCANSSTQEKKNHKSNYVPLTNIPTKIATTLLS